MLFLAVTLLGLFSIYPASSDRSDIGLTPDKMIENHGYACETHYITTEDGYILAYHRIPRGINDDENTKKPAVLLMHGLTSSSAEFVSMGPDRGFAYILADEGYDVWLANARGNGFSRNHTTLDPDVDADKFYDFTWHEIGYYDIASAIDYILDVNGDSSLYYIGHSQGATVFLVLASTRPDYNDKIRLASLMAPAAILKHFPNILVQDVSKYVDKIERILNNWKIYEIPYVKEIRDMISIHCADPSTDSFCDTLYQLLHNAKIEDEFLPVIHSNDPSNSGMKQLVHYGQEVRDGGFNLFNYGKEKNFEIYGTETPPPYDLSKISSSIAFYYGKNDGLITIEDEQTLASMVPNVVNNYLVPDDTFTHGDFAFAKDVVELVYNELMRVMKEF